MGTEERYAFNVPGWEHSAKENFLANSPKQPQTVSISSATPMVPKRTATVENINEKSAGSLQRVRLFAHPTQHRTQAE
jgi:hypothetical protein